MPRPACPQFASPLTHEDVFNGTNPNTMEAIKTEEPSGYDEFECLNLNICIPRDKPLDRKGLPVIICIHGLVDILMQYEQ